MNYSLIQMIPMIWPIISKVAIECLEKWGEECIMHNLIASETQTHVELTRPIPTPSTVLLHPG